MARLLAPPIAHEMSAKLTFTPSESALRVLRHLALAGSTIGAFGGVVSAHQAVSRQTQCLERILEQKRLLHSLSNSNSNSTAYRKQLFQAAEDGQLDRLKASRKQTRRNASQEIDSLPRTDGQSRRPMQRADNHNQTILGTHFSYTAQRIIDSTLQPHKAPSHAVFGRPTKSELDLHQGQEGWKSREKNHIMKASMLPHKPPQYHVHGKPSQGDMKRLPTLDHCVERWLHPETPTELLSTPSDVTEFRSFFPTVNETFVGRASKPHTTSNVGSPLSSGLMNKPTSRSFTTRDKPVAAAAQTEDRGRIMKASVKNGDIIPTEGNVLTEQSKGSRKLSIRLTRSGRTTLRWQQ